MTPYYSDAATTLYYGKCENVLPLLERVDHVITDPPYSEHVHSKNMRARKNLATPAIAEKRELGFDSLTLELMAFAAAQFGRLANRWVLVFSDVESCHLWRDTLEANDLEYLRTGIWLKPNATPQFTGDRPAPGYETITISHARSTRKRWNGGGEHAVWTYRIVANRPYGEARLHTTQKPLPLMKRLVVQFTDPGELILDAFAGSGTTLVAAKTLGRRAVGIEMDERYCEITARRLEATVPLDLPERVVVVQARLEMAL